jgi:hypothetical protein
MSFVISIQIQIDQFVRDFRFRTLGRNADKQFGFIPQSNLFRGSRFLFYEHIKILHTDTLIDEQRYLEK